MSRSKILCSSTPHDDAHETRAGLKTTSQPGEVHTMAHLQALAERNVLVGDVRVFVVVSGPVLRTRVNLGWWGRIRAAPLLHLIFAKLGHGLLLVQAGEGAVHALVEPPILVDRNVLLASDPQHLCEHAQTNDRH